MMVLPFVLFQAYNSPSTLFFSDILCCDSFFLSVSVSHCGSVSLIQALEVCVSTFFSSSPFVSTFPLSVLHAVQPCIWKRKPRTSLTMQPLGFPFPTGFHGLFPDRLLSAVSKSAFCHWHLSLQVSSP